MLQKLFFWNTRGLNDPSKQTTFCSWLHSSYSLFGAILETHVKLPYLNQLMLKVCPNWNFFSNHNSDDDGRILLIWKQTVKVRILDQTRQSITAEVKMPRGPVFTFTAIYASNLAAERTTLWAHLNTLRQAYDLDVSPWIVAGDFNQIIHPAEHSNPAVNTLTSRMSEFRDALLEADLSDLRYYGPHYTWTNKRLVTPVAKKIDRVLSNFAWIEAYPDSAATFHAHDFSDHCPCILNLAIPLPSSGTKPFKFLNYLTKHHLFDGTVEEHWNLPGTSADNLKSFCFKLKALKKPLQLLNKENFSHIQERVSETNELLNILQIQALNNPNQSTFQAELDLQSKLHFLKGIEEDFFKQKSRINWLQGGDHNTSYFHRTVKVRNSGNAIRSLQLADGSTTSDPMVMSQLAVNHFNGILAPPCTSTVTPSIAWLSSLITFRCTPVHQAFLMSIPTSEEITRVVFRLNPNKAPGPDGFTAGFYTAAWKTLGLDLLSSISGLFSSGFLPQSVNATILALVPKKPGADMITDFRPISCCNTTYKIISKLLVARLKPLMHKLIQPNQTAFIKDRLLLENTLLASELIQGYHLAKGPKRITIKVDLEKAFDTVDWGFIMASLRSIHVPELYIRWINTCITTPAYSVGFNGSLHGFFKGKRGLRQGDPLSPYLFVIAMNYLSLLLDKAAVEGIFGYHHNCEPLKLTHLCFADDLLIFTDGTLRSVTNILEVLRDFHSISGLALNINKTSFLSAGLDNEEILAITEATGIKHIIPPTTYLGLPLSPRKLTKHTCAPLIQKIKSRITSWAAKHLSFAGRLQLLKAVVNGITTFWSSAFIIPKGCIKEINTMCAAFLWKGSLDGRYSARVAWTELTLSKQEGGLGLRDLEKWNETCALKLIWMIFFRPSSLWVAWFRRQILNNDLHKFWTVTSKQRYSWLVRKLLKLRETIYPWIKLQIGDGRNTSFWFSNWSPFGKLATFLSHDFSANSGIARNLRLADLWHNGGWTLPPARSDNLVQVLSYLTTQTLSAIPDGYNWATPTTASSGFSSSVVYDLLRTHKEEVTWHSEVWFSGNIPRHAFLVWLFVLNRSPTKDRLLKWGLTTNSICILCNNQNESRDHLLFECRFSSSVWLPVASRANLPPDTNWNSIINILHSISSPRHRKTLSLLVWQATIHTLWQERNNRTHRSSFRSADSLITLIDTLIRNRCSSLRPTRPKFASAMLQLWFAGPPSS